ncbi:hypothetical protein J1614_003989 [Plenodomus biglobosus]|nr:hypothetical protein J1614_003989 [Plenodomus biglobosus]
MVVQGCSHCQPWVQVDTCTIRVQPRLAADSPGCSWIFDTQPMSQASRNSLIDLFAPMISMLMLMLDPIFREPVMAILQDFAVALGLQLGHCKTDLLAGSTNDFLLLWCICTLISSWYGLPFTLRYHSYQDAKIDDLVNTGPCTSYITS